MRLPEIAHGKEHTGIKRLAPNILEQLELAKRMDHFLQEVMMKGIQPAQQTRELKDYRSKQPNGIAHVSVAYSDERDGRYSAEVQASHRPSGVKAHYGLLAGGEHWLRSDNNPRGSQSQTILDSDHMLQDMLEYAPEDGDTAKLLDGITATRALVGALFADMNRGAHYKAGSDHYKAVVRTLSEDGYASARQIELVDSRINNNRLERRLSVTAFANLGPGPVDVNQKLIYDVHIDRKGAIESDGIQLMHTSSDGLSPQALENLAESSDVVTRRIDILHQALDDLSSSTFAA